MYQSHGDVCSFPYSFITAYPWMANAALCAAQQGRGVSGLFTSSCICSSRPPSPPVPHPPPAFFISTFLTCL